VFHTGERELGLVGAMPVDAVEVALDMDRFTMRQPGIAGSAIIRGRTTLMVNLDELVSASGWSHAPVEQAPAQPVKAASQSHGHGRGITILLAEDSDFFRRQVCKYLEGDGYTVLATEDGQAAWEALQNSAEQVQLVVTDIEMPRLNGLELTRRIRASEQYAHLPILALTSLASQDEVDLGRQAGVDAYEIKLDKEKLLDSVREILARAI
jgi:two-component system chemotaxis sensor kinase CheA